MMTAQRVAGVCVEGLPGTEVGVRPISMSQCGTSGLAWRRVLYHEN